MAENGNCRSKRPPSLPLSGRIDGTVYFPTLRRQQVVQLSVLSSNLPVDTFLYLRYFLFVQKLQIYPMPLTPVEQRFVLHWGEMGTRWGINRTVAQVHALLFVSPNPLHAEEIANTLSVARSNVSTSLRELQGWGIVRVVHVLGDRRDHFESLKDVWDIFRIVAEE